MCVSSRVEQTQIKYRTNVSLREARAMLGDLIMSANNENDPAASRLHRRKAPTRQARMRNLEGGGVRIVLILAST